MKSKIVIILLIIIQGYSADRITGKYEAFWYETYHQLRLKNWNKYEYKSEGHLGFGEYHGEYEIVNDTLTLKGGEAKKQMNKFLVAEDGCLIELETRFEYCKRNEEEWGSGRRAINYPQLKEKTKEEKENVLLMLEIALTNPEIREYFEDTTKNLVVQEYYEIKKENNVSITCFGKPIYLKSKEEIVSEGIEEYLIIDELNVGLTSAMIDFQVMPEFSVGILDFFTRQKDTWKLNKRRTE